MYTMNQNHLEAYPKVNKGLYDGEYTLNVNGRMFRRNRKYLVPPIRRFMEVNRSTRTNIANSSENPVVMNTAVRRVFSTQGEIVLRRLAQRLDGPK